MITTLYNDGNEQLQMKSRFTSWSPHDLRDKYHNNCEAKSLDNGGSVHKNQLDQNLHVYWPILAQNDAW